MRRFGLAGVFAAWVALLTAASSLGAGVAQASRPRVFAQGYWLANTAGQVFEAGNAPNLGSVPAGQAGGTDPVVAIAATADGKGFWLTSSNGTVWNFGDAKKFTARPKTASPIVAIAGVGENGIVLVAANGGVFCYGGAHYHGSIPGQLGAKPLRAPIVGIATTPGETGYWLAGADGGVFSFGQAHFHGSVLSEIGKIHLRGKIAGIGAVPDGTGYWLAARDGGIFTFGLAQFYGSLPEYLHLSGTNGSTAPPGSKWGVGMAPTATGKGYMLAINTGHIYFFGTGDYLPQTHTAGQVVGIARAV